MDSHSAHSRSTHSTALLDVEESKTAKTKEKLVFSLLQEKKRAHGTFKIGPSPSLQKVKDFLPQLMKANVKVQEDIMSDPAKQTKYDIENVEEASGPVIEMDLALYNEEDSGSDCSANLYSDSDMETTPLGPINESNIKLPGSLPKSNLVEIVDDSCGKEKN